MYSQPFTRVVCGARLRAMIAKAWAWARQHNRLRVNPVHGEEEIYLVLSETFNAKEMEEEEMTRQGNMEVQVGLHFTKRTVKSGSPKYCSQFHLLNPSFSATPG